jgi:uncharacterized protein (UPF0548 family)
MTEGLFDGLALGAPTAPGFRRDRASGRISADPGYFPVARAALFDWQLQRRSGMRVLGGDGRDAPPVAEGAAATLRIPLGPGLALRAPVRVLRVIDDEPLVGFVYRAEQGHPVHGEEAFLIRRDAVGAVWVEIESVSKAAMPFALLAPVARLTQARYTKRYLRALEQKPGRR